MCVFVMRILVLHGNKTNIDTHTHTQTHTHIYMCVCLRVCVCVCVWGEFSYCIEIKWSIQQNENLLALWIPSDLETLRYGVLFYDIHLVINCNLKDHYSLTLNLTEWFDSWHSMTGDGKFWKKVKSDLLKSDSWQVILPYFSYVQWVK